MLWPRARIDDHRLSAFFQVDQLDGPVAPPHDKLAIIRAEIKTECAS